MENKQLSKKVNILEDKVTRLQSSNSKLKDELALIKDNYETLVSGINERFDHLREAVSGMFRNR